MRCQPADGRANIQTFNPFCPERLIAEERFDDCRLRKGQFEVEQIFL